MTDTSISQSDEDAFRLALSRFTSKLRTAVPGIVDSEPKKNGRFWCVDVIPAVRRLIKSSNNGSRTESEPKIANVPIYLTGSKSLGLSVTVPLKLGDECLLVVSDRGLDNWQITDGPQDPPELKELRHHDLSDCFCLPLCSQLASINSYNNDAVEIRNSDGTTRLSVRSNEIEQVVGSGATKLTNGLLTINANVVINGSLDSNGGDFNHDGVNVGKDHNHKPEGELKDSLNGNVAGRSGKPES
ncbi:hypothetical protein F9L16_23895 [Agarivorans sp. B2Z047]|uniref:Gp138 family membrane-puncturing spike protein n=1 Tax=Agarivorans sp. B2Z047 TaxID=2652721 RepID=UPI00128BE663|nr:Gp138 family membrane-puncturing spike protein [Agarivorans sp. B2Z047]MPW31993.1 hypothetical protein [Agarivorans sp. B2Z047]UQN41865.1 hypothetical protein LQZ07_19115 [Agarivorans sp. B2Z047]